MTKVITVRGGRRKSRPALDRRRGFENYRPAPAVAAFRPDRGAGPVARLGHGGNARVQTAAQRLEVDRRGPKRPKPSTSGAGPPRRPRPTVCGPFRLTAACAASRARTSAHSLILRRTRRRHEFARHAPSSWLVGEASAPLGCGGQPPGRLRRWRLRVLRNSRRPRSPKRELVNSAIRPNRKGE